MRLQSESIFAKCTLFKIEPCGLYNKIYCLYMRVKHTQSNMKRSLFSFILIVAAIICCNAYPSPEDVRYIDRDPAGAHQLASWLAYQMRPKEFVAPMVTVDAPVIPYRLPLQGKRNSEVTNAIIGSEETQKMYRDGR